MVFDKLMKKIKGKTKNASDDFGSLFESVKEENPKNKKQSSFYNNDSDNEDLGTGGFYGLKDLDAEDKQEEEKQEASRIFSFAWWEYAIILIEFFMLVYVILLFAGVVSI
jgi:hypothetical protein